MAETSSLLNCRTLTRTGGSNPPLTAKRKPARLRAGFFMPKPLQAQLVQGWGIKKRQRGALGFCFGPPKVF